MFLRFDQILYMKEHVNFNIDKTMFPDICKYRVASEPHLDRARDGGRRQEEEQVQPFDSSLRVQVQRHDAG